MKKSLAFAALFAASVSSIASAGTLGWTEYVIRGSASAQDNGSYYEFITDTAGEKAALGTNLISGSKIGDITHLAITRTDSNSAGGSAYAPYMNFWVTDGAGHYAVLANEPSNPEWTGTSEWDTTGANLLTKSVKVFEIQPGFILPLGVSVNPANGITGVNFSAFADYVIDAPGSHPWAGTGAPGAYGFNWVFGDTQANYVSGSTPGYLVSDPIATASAAVPLPASATAGLTLLSLLAAPSLLRRLRHA